jgi:DNA-binding NarL/FixJ family response regulator
MDTENKTYKIILVDDHRMFRNGLQLMIETEKVGRVIGEAENGQQFLELLENEMPDVVLMDIDMPIMNGVTATQKAVALYPDIKIIGLSMFGDEKFYTKMLKAGAKGFMLKKSGLDELIKGINEVASGECYFSNELLRKIVISLGDQKQHITDSPEDSITDRELEILQLLANGCSTLEIADEIHLSPKTVDSYRSRLLTKTESRNTVDLVIFALKKGLISIG